mmetsp:Transcript_53240/g.62166  ORF Transcript_53240/g.62166 Transcript_53240/m.62166 type:complete len:86 (+) Transcript_53240:361-618(+)
MLTLCQLLSLAKNTALSMVRCIHLMRFISLSTIKISAQHSPYHHSQWTSVDWGEWKNYWRLANTIQQRGVKVAPEREVTRPQLVK